MRTFCPSKASGKENKPHVTVTSGRSIPSSMEITVVYGPGQLEEILIDLLTTLGAEYTHSTDAEHPEEE